MDGPSYGIGTKLKDFKAPNTPGPDRYDIDQTFAKVRRKDPSWKMGSSDRNFYKFKEEVQKPNPTSYDPKIDFVKEKIVGTFSFGTSER